MIDSGRGAAKAEDTQGTPTQSHISPSILVYEEKQAVDPSQAELQEGAVREGCFEEFKEALAACACYMTPSPYLSLKHKVSTFSPLSL